MAIISSVVLILVLIAKVSLPLFFSANAELYSQVETTGENKILAVGMDEYLETGYTLDDLGRLVFFEISNGRELDRVQLKAGGSASRLVSVENYGQLNHALLWDDGSLTIEQVQFKPVFDESNGNKRSIVHQINQRAVWTAKPETLSMKTLARISNDDRRTRVDLLNDGRLELQQQEISENFLGEEEVVENSHDLYTNLIGVISALTMSSDGFQLYVGTDRGEISYWDLTDIEDPKLVGQLQAFADQREITALNMVFGDVSLAVGDAHGEVTTWFPVRNDGGGKTLTRIHNLSSHNDAVQVIYPSTRDKTVFSLAADGLHLDHMTSERFLLALNPPGKLVDFALTTRGNALIGLTESGHLLSWKLDIPHPEVSIKTLFGKVWYEGYDEPVYAWQSSSSSDDYEPKLSLMPLIFGTLKGTFMPCCSPCLWRSSGRFIPANLLARVYVRSSNLP